MTESPHWPAAAGHLLALDGGHEVGLHFNLTHPFNQPEKPVGRIMVSAWLRMIDPANIEKRFDEQWQAFTRAYGREPDYVDGHQHVHAFPVIREVVAARLKELAPRAWVRSLDVRVDSPKAGILAWASHGLTKVLASEGLATNRSFAGLRPYSPVFDFRKAFREWMGNSADGTLLMCHPGLESQDRTDPIAACRPLELAYLQSDQFSADSREMGVSWSPLDG